MREFVNRVHFIGIGGIGMSGIAEVLLELGFSVSGSDHNPHAGLARLREAGAQVWNTHSADNVRDADAVVVSGAVAADNVEVRAARDRNIPLLPRAEMLAELMRFRKGIAIAGTHGKTTTTSLTAAVLTRAGLDPTFIVGGVVNSAHTNARLGRGEYMVAEADESDASFLHLQPHLAVMTNIDADHLESYDDNFQKLRETCLAFLSNLPFYGLAVLCFEDAEVRALARDLHKPAVSYGFAEEVDFRALKVRQIGRESLFEVARRGQNIGAYKLALPGRHNVLNALAAIAIADRLRIPDATVAKALAEFQGIRRRFQVLGAHALPHGTATVVDDYAHHPTELAATLAAARVCWPGRRLVVLFQPHRYTRTRALFDDFVQVLAGVEHLIVLQVYAAGEPASGDADSRALCRAIRKRGREPIYAADFAELGAMLPNILRADDILLTLGAGDIGRFANSLCAPAPARRQRG